MLVVLSSGGPLRTQKVNGRTSLQVCLPALGYPVLFFLSRGGT
jgi:hypothetical protein